MAFLWLVFDKAGIPTMSHLSILPTALTDLERLASVLIGYAIERHGMLSRFWRGVPSFRPQGHKPLWGPLRWETCPAIELLELLADVERQVP